MSPTERSTARLLSDATSRTNRLFRAPMKAKDSTEQPLKPWPGSDYLALTTLATPLQKHAPACGTAICHGIRAVNVLLLHGVPQWCSNCRLTLRTAFARRQEGSCLHNGVGSNRRSSVGSPVTPPADLRVPASPTTIVRERFQTHPRVQISQLAIVSLVATSCSPTCEDVRASVNCICDPVSV